MIYTRYGSPVEFLAKDGEWIKVKYMNEEVFKIWAKSEFKADNGISEIEEAIKNLPEMKLQRGY